MNQRCRFPLFVVAGSLLVLASAAAAAPGSGLAVLSRLPSSVVGQIPAPAIDALASGEMSEYEFLDSLGMSLLLPDRAPTELQEKQFITHWLYHYTCLRAGIGETPVTEADITGRCSSDKLTDDAAAPSMSYGYWTSPSITTYYSSAPFDSSTCTYDNTDLTRYFVTWVRSATARSLSVWVGASDYYKLWINGTLVLSRTSGGGKPYTVDEYKGSVSLRAGWNLLVVRQTYPQLGPSTDPSNDIKYKYFSLRFVSDAAGTPVTDLVAAYDPQCDEADISKAAYTRVIVPTIAHLTGIGGSQWRTDVTLRNGYHMRWQFRFRYFREGVNSGTPTSEKFVELAPFETKVFADALGASLFNVASDQKGYFWMLQAAYDPMVYGGWLQAKMYNQASSGTFGMLVPVQYPYQGTSWSVLFYGLRNGSYRTNFGLAPGKNVGASARIRLTLFGSDFPAVVSKEYSGINGFWQLNNIFSDMGQGSVNTSTTSLYLEITDNATDTYWYPYVTVNDGNPPSGPTGTSDPTMFLPGYWYDTPPEIN